MQTSHITPLETGHLLQELRPRLAVIHHLTVRCASSTVMLMACLSIIAQVCADCIYWMGRIVVVSR